MKQKIIKKKMIYYEIYKNNHFIGYQERKNSKTIYNSLAEMCADRDTNDFGGV